MKSRNIKSAKNLENEESHISTDTLFPKKSLPKFKKLDSSSSTSISNNISGDDQNDKKEKVKFNIGNNSVQPKRHASRPNININCNT